MSIFARTRQGTRVLESGWAALSVIVAVMSLAMLMATSTASAETRTLKLHFTHTNERAEVTFKRNGRYIKEGLDKINWILRDWRRNEATEMDPRLLDLLWEVYQQSGSRGYIHVISAYRSPATNQMLRSRSSGVADNSQHTRGKAIDFFLPDVPVQRLRDLGLRHHGGGVGFYPRSGSPFVHLDTGSVRHWPRMTRQQLMAVFPDGRTMHVPSDGRPLPGYEQAVAAYQARQRGQSSVQVASEGSGRSGGSGLLAGLFGGGSRNASSDAAATSSGAGAGTPTPSSAPTPSAPVRQTAPEQAAPVPSAPAPVRPETMLAEMPADRVPVPMAAPRPSVPVGEAPQVAEAENIPFQVRDEADIREDLEQLGEVQVAAANVPVPMARPNRPAIASEDVAPISALAARPRDPGANAIEELLSADRQLVAAAVVPIPALRPGRPAAEPESDPEATRVILGEADDAPIVLAALPSAATDIGGLAGLNSPERAEALALKERAAAAARDNRLTPISAAASPRMAIMEREAGTDVVAALDSGVRTTARAARPSADDARARQRRAQLRPIEGDSARWAFEANSITMVTNGTRAPSFAQRALTSVPRTVYTAGFRQDAPRDAHRFSGQAVQFMSVARFNTN